MELSWLISIFVGLLVLLAIRGRTPSGRLLVVLVLPALFTVAIGASTIWAQVAAGYPDDSFWSLGTGGRAGVVLISSLGYLIIFVCVGRLALWTRNWSVLVALPISILMGASVFGLIYSLSPQVFYSLYQFIFPDLPVQIVIKHVLDFDKLIRVAQLSAGSPLADHLAGVGLWGTIVYITWLILGTKVPERTP